MLRQLQSLPIISKMIGFFRHRQTLVSSGILIFWMFASRGLGALRTVLIARLPTVEADMLNGSMVIADNIITIFILGAVTTSILPQVIKISTQFQDKEAANNQSIYVSWVLLGLGSFLAVTSILSILFTESLLQLLNPDLFESIQSLGRAEEFMLLTRLMLVVPTIFGVKTIFTAFLNAKKAFSIFAIDGVLINIGFIFGLTLLYTQFGISGVLWGNIIGMLVATTVFAVAARRHGFCFRLGYFDGLTSILHKTFRLYTLWLLLVPSLRVSSTIVAMSVTQADGQISAVNLAFDIQSVFLGVVGSIGAVILPNMAKLAQEKDSTCFWSYIFKYLKWISGLSILGTIATIVGTPFLIWLVQFLGILNSDSFLSSPENIASVQFFVAIAASTLIFQSLTEMLYRYFTAIENAWPPLAASLGGNAVAILVAILFSQQWSAGFVAVFGFALNSVISFAILAVFLYLSWQKKSHVSSI